ncbi:MAG: helix-turn-helix domain-containing protein [Bacteroidetes bacterium]|nr:helix-turn-helix domain-containing protein [Bacteroidota bacterium]
MQRPALKPSFLSIPEAATFLNVSQATVRNWRKAGLLPESLSAREVQNLHTSIADGAVLRLNKRANKSKSTKTFIPVECAGSAETARQIELIVALLKEEYNDVRDAM